jgi:hypothetical protein
MSKLGSVVGLVVALAGGWLVWQLLGKTGGEVITKGQMALQNR